MWFRTRSLSYAERTRKFDFAQEFSCCTTVTEVEAVFTLLNKGQIVAHGLGIGATFML